MTEQAERYDRIGLGYARWWAPVLRPAIAELLDRVAADVTGTERILDIGTGTGQLALAALGRWPGVRVTGIDASSGMRDLAEAEADRSLHGADRRRYDTLVAFADELPFGDGTFDAALSSFVMQLVPSRPRALREARRVLRRDGLFAHVTWLQGGQGFAGDEVYDELLDELGLEPRDGGGPSGDLASTARATGELRHAGFADARAEAGTLEHRFTVEGYLGFLTEFDEVSFLAELEPDVREQLLGELRTRLDQLSPAAMTMRFPIVFAMGRRSRR
jgi:SAM-dependent methyltransferase